MGAGLHSVILTLQADFRQLRSKRDRYLLLFIDVDGVAGCYRIYDVRQPPGALRAGIGMSRKFVINGSVNEPIQKIANQFLEARAAQLRFHFWYKLQHGIETGATHNFTVPYSFSQLKLNIVQQNAAGSALQTVGGHTLPHVLL
jgi:hypothetical protein